VLFALEIAFAIQREALLLRAALRPAALQGLLWGGGVALAAMFALGLATLIQQRARQRRNYHQAKPNAQPHKALVSEFRDQSSTG